jgi:glutathione synthase/RimK-type ligase-like ATP-grasp enzyme
MLNSQRVFVEAVRKYGAERGINIEVHAGGWLLAMHRGETRRFAFAYDIGLNSAVAHRIANDKSATSEVLALSGVACVPHSLFLNPQLNAYLAPSNSWEAMLALLQQYPNGIVVKPNEGTSGRSVYRVLTRPSLELAVSRIFASHVGLAIAPYLDIEDEVRVVVLDGAPLLVYRKERATVTGNGRHSLLELALTTLATEQRSAVLAGMIADLDSSALDEIVPDGQRRVLNWRHNLENGAEPLLLEHGDMRDACVALAVQAARTIGIRFASIDVVRAGARWQVLEVNSGVMMEALSKRHPERVYAAYSAALDKVFR